MCVWSFGLIIDMICIYCHDCTVDPRRVKLGYKSCMDCGEDISRKKRHTIVPMHKSNYVVLTNMDDLKGINNKGGQYA
jgi:hypothetical protein